MLHESTRQLIQKLHELTMRGGLAWREGERQCSVFETEGYQVEIEAEPPTLRVLTNNGRELERASAADLAAEPWPDGSGDYATRLAEMARSANRVARGAEHAIASILSALSAPAKKVEAAPPAPHEPPPAPVAETKPEPPPVQPAPVAAPEPPPAPRSVSSAPPMRPMPQFQPRPPEPVPQPVAAAPAPEPPAPPPQPEPRPIFGGISSFGAKPTPANNAAPSGAYRPNFGLRAVTRQSVGEQPRSDKPPAAPPNVYKPWV
jgi:hypothetical protein